MLEHDAQECRSNSDEHLLEQGLVAVLDQLVREM
jgi:hypothetical protein